LWARSSDLKMLARIRKRSSRKERRGISSVVGGMIVFGVILTSVYGFFFLIAQSQQLLWNSSNQNQQLAGQKTDENLAVTGMLMGPAIGFSVNNTGITAVIASYVLTDISNGKIVQVNSGSGSTPALPYTISQGGSAVFVTGAFYTPGNDYMIKLITSRGSIFVGTYPPENLPLNSISSSVAAGLGSVSMDFTSYNFYSFTNAGCGCVIDINHPHSGALLPNGVTPAFSMKVTNNDPAVGTITLNSHSDIYLYQTCQSGCGGNVPTYVYYAVNVAPNGTITSTSQGSFVPIEIPYGASKTIFFASKYDLSLGSFASFQIVASIKEPLGEYDVFVIISGSDTQSQQAILYGQNLPFAGSFLSDTVAWYSETPASCVGGNINSFSLMVNNSVLSVDNIYQVSMNASMFTNLKVTQIPNGWNSYVSTSGIVIWNTTKNGIFPIVPGHYSTFGWNGTAPSTIGTVVAFPLTLGFTGKGIITSQQSAEGCFVS
jgi:hypothetical protein